MVNFCSLFKKLLQCIYLAIHNMQDITKIRHTLCFSEMKLLFFPEMYLEILAVSFLVYSTDLQWLGKLISFMFPNKVFLGKLKLKHTPNSIKTSQKFLL